MDAKTLAKIVQIVVQEEVTKILKKEILIMKQELLKEIKKNAAQLVEYYPKQTTPIDTLDDVIGNVLQQERKKQPIINTQKFTKDPMLNSVLNETAMNLVPIDDDYPTMGNVKTSNNAPSFGSYREMMTKEMGIHSPGVAATPSVAEMLPDTDINGNPLRVQNVPDAVSKALTRDYRSLVKKMTGKV